MIDTHTHFYDPSRPQGVPWPPRDDALLYRTVLPAHHRALAEPLGITGAIVVEASAWLDDNQWVLDLARDDPWILGLVGHVDPGAGFAQRLGRFAGHPQLCGIRLGGRPFADVGEGTLLRDVATLGERDLALDVLAGGAQLEGVAAVARRLPSLRVVVNHIGLVPVTGAAPDATWLERVEALAAASPQVYCKLSALAELAAAQPAPTDPDYYRPTLDALWRTFGPDRLVFGSNWPVSDRAAPLAAVVAVVRRYVDGLGRAAAEGLWHANARRAYHVPDRR